MPVKKIKLPDSSVIDVNDSRIHIYRTLTGTAADTTTPYNHAKWDVTDSTITEYVDGMVVCLKVPVAGHGTYGTGFQINNLGYKPVVYNVNSMVSTRYGVGSVIWCVYNATQTASLYINSTSAVTVTGCWQVQDYDANTNTIGYQLRTNSSTRPVSSTTYRYRLMFSSLDNSKWVPATNSTSTNATSSRNVNQEVINPWGRIVYYSTTTARTAGQSLSATAQWDRYVFNLGYSFNDGTALDLTFPGPVYIKCTPQAGGGAIIDSTTPYTQSLPSTADGKIYIYLGQAYSASEVELIDYHPVLYHDGTKISLWTGAVAESDLFDCVMTLENNVWSCDHTWAEIYAAHQAGKLVRLTKSNDSVFMPVSIGSVSGIFSACLHMSLGTITESSGIGSFIYDSSGDLMPLGWSFHQTSFNAFTSAYKDKLDGIAAGAEVNVQSDWNQSDSTADDFIKNKPSIPDTVSGVNDGTNWTSLTIGNTTKAIPQRDVLVCTYSNGSVDRTPQEIYEAKAAGREVVCILGDFMYYLISVSYYGNDSYSVVFESTVSPHYSPETKYIKCVDGSWSIGGTVLQKQLIGSGSGQNIKTINNQSLLGSGNITIQGGSSTLSGLSDTTITTPSDGQVLTYDNATSKWVNANAEKEIFWCTMTSTTENNTTTWSCDKTWSEIYAAHQAGKLVYLKKAQNDEIFTPFQIISDSGLFSQCITISFFGNFFVAGSFEYNTNDGWTYTMSNALPIDVLSFFPTSYGTAGQVLTIGSGGNSMGWANVPTELPSITGNAGKVLTVNSGATGTEWTTPSGGGIQELTSPIRIWELNPGVYILPSPCTVYYNGSTNTSSSATIYGGILQVFSTSSDTIRKWKVTTDLSEDTNPAYPNRFYWGATTSSSGNISSAGYITSQRSACNSGTSDYSISFNNIGSNLARNSYSVLSNGVVTGKISSSTTSIPVALTTDLSAETAVVMTVINPSDYNIAGNYVGRQDLYVTELNRHFYRFFNFTNSGITSIVTNTTGADANGWVEIFERLPSIDELNETNISSPTNGQILKYNSTTLKWENASETTELPSITGNANKVLAVNNSATGVEWVTKPSSGLTNYDFTHTANTTISGSTTTVTFAANTRGSAMLTISADLGLTIACNNGSDNYIWVKNTGSSEVDITISAVTKNSTNVSNVYVPSDGISVPAGGLCEIGVIVNTDGAFLTSRNDLAL